MRHPERDEVERPMIDQLVAMGWTHLPFAAPGQGRQTFGDVILEERLRDVVKAINLDPDGRPWLDDERLTTIVNRVIREPEQGVQGNVAFTELLTGAELTVVGRPDWDDGLRQPIKLVDWKHPERNELLVVSQFRIDTFKGRRPYVVLDLVLFVNGLPFAVIECKNPGPTAVDEAIIQLHGYVNDAPDLARFAQLLIATDRETAQYGTITSPHEYFAAWRFVEPAVEQTIRAETGKPADQPLLEQEILVGEMLRLATLLNVIRDFTVGQVVDDRQVKIVARWQQYRAVRRLVRRLEERQRAISATVAPDPHGGVTWHTQGSGKSLTMSFLVRVLRGHEELRGFKVVVVTDRLDLEEQIRHSLGTTGETPLRATSVADARVHLARARPDLVLVTIQKSRDEDEPDSDEDESQVVASALNDSDEIVVLVDEAHRSQSSWQHARLRGNLPNAVLIGFTGTPILRGRKKTTQEIFGPILDVYALKDAERDRAIVPLRYESREVPGAVIDRAILDAGFADAVPGDGNQREQAVRQLARHREVLEAAELIRAKADDMFRYWVRYAMPDRFSAQVVAVSRKAAVRYQRALLEARARLLVEVQELSPALLYDPMAWEEADERTQILLEAAEHRELLERITAAAVISQGSTPDDAAWQEWTDKARHKEYIRRFKDGFGEALESEPDRMWSDHAGALSHWHPIHDGGGEPWRVDVTVPGGEVTYSPADAAVPAEPIVFIVVKSMLLTGFDAPVEQILFLDRPMQSVELLQAIARPNRPRKHKAFGLIVDYVGVSAELAQALSDYDPEHLREVVGDTDADAVMMPLDEAVVPELRDQQQRVAILLAEQGVSGLDTPEQREELLALLDDPELRAEFDDVTRTFLTALNAVLPRAEALEYQEFARNLGIVQYLARRRYRDARAHFNPYRYGLKVRQLIDAHIRVEGILQRIPPVTITADDFAEKVDALPDDRARALEMKHAMREHIRACFRS
ncbi:type I restriction endonuclease subunit R [Saccharopolyspora spinosa]|uniref:Type I restriction enzyme endonuclease subunit n=1 Tax=Saccharopolyspora spinosa TaxID=60894 RepID=A0A2N3XUD2_SACSN|nr:HsdR family type I site-specific deoxyribonuclease [Saccharopolyspora spinosa]PKW14298.1 type I restriction enzyme R subunit [Saccharopolyspora spinosa]